MISLNNLTLKFVEVSFYNVARSMTICFNVLFSYLVLDIKTSQKTMMTLLVVVLGFIVGTGGEVNVSVIGSMFGIMASISVALNSIFTKKVSSLVNDNKWQLSAYNNMNGVFLFLPLIITFEMDALIMDERLYTFSFWFWMTVTGVFGFAMGIVTITQINLTR